ncbi:MAG: hypothetical protein IT435_09840 [Phycisphaerales bacterium]|nr:hypothetical protein [Phycisphaerales bacterium]
MNGGGRTAPAAGTASSAGPGWSIASLASSAYVRAGAGWLACSHRLWLDWAILGLEEGIRAALGLRATISPLRAPSGNATAPVFAASIAIRRVDAAGAGESASEVGKLTVFLRPDAARALADAVMLDAAGLRGHGGPTSAEVGVLEFAILVLADSMNRRLADNPAAPGVLLSITEFIAGAEAQTRLRSSIHPLVNLLVSVADRQGEVAVGFDGWAIPPSEVGMHARPGDAQGAVTAGVALPAVHVSPDDLDNAAIGDSVVLGISGIDGRLTGAALVTLTGWELCPVVFMHDSPTMVGVRCQGLSPHPHPGWVSGDDAPVLIPLIGQTPIPALSLRSWEVDRIQDFPKSTWEVSLWRNGRVWADGGLVSVGEELAVRIDRIHPASAEGGQ